MLSPDATSSTTPIPNLSGYEQTFDMDGEPILLCTKLKGHCAPESPKSSPIFPLTSPGAKNLIQIGTTPPKTAPETISSSTHPCTPTVETSFDNGLPFSNTPQDPLPPKRTPPHVSIISATTFKLMMKLGEDETFLLDIQPTTEPVLLHAMKNQPAPTTLLHREPLPKEESEMFKVVVPEEYQDFFDIFSRTNAKTLLPHCPYDHTIEIENDGSPPHGPIYPLSNTELEALCDYLEDMLGKGFIRSSQSPGGTPIMFAKKKDGSLRMCVDYQGLNHIT